MAILALAVLLQAASCTKNANSAEVDAGKALPKDIAMDSGDVSADISKPPPAEHKVPIGARDLTFYVGPYVMHTTQTRVTIVWETKEAGNTRIEYGTTGDYGKQVTGKTGTMHELVVPDLAPATIYHYRACTDQRCTADLTFSTAPLPGQKFRFAVYGDSRSAPDIHRTVVENIIRDKPVIVFNVGDIVESGKRAEYKGQHFDPSRQLGHYIPIYVAIGNHEWKEDDNVGEPDVPNFREYMAFPVVPGLRIAELSYSFTFGDAFFVVLDNTLDGGDLFFSMGGSEAPLAKWLREQAESEEARKARWRFAFMHYPPASPCHENWINITATREKVVPLLRKNGFDAMFTGHVHDYERQNWEGFPVIITGGGGAGTESDETCTGDLPELVKISYAHHHLTVDLGDDSAHIRAVDLDGRVFDEITISK